MRFFGIILKKYGQSPDLRTLSIFFLFIFAKLWYTTPKGCAEIKHFSEIEK